MVKVETYEIEEAIDGTTPEIEDEARRLIEDLDLAGQRELMTPVSGDLIERFQYPEMTKAERAVYNALFPDHTKLSEYSAGMIPVRVLQVAAHAREYCDELYVWHRRVKDPDPLLVGIKGANEWNGKRYLLARWGDALKDWSELVKEATAVIRRDFESKIQKNLARAKEQLASLDVLVADKVAGGDADVY